jgi:serine/threonine-protein kinase
MPSAATDQYSLACSAFEMLSGAGPFIGSADALMHAQLEQIPPRLSQRVPGTARGADSVIDRALAKDPERRYLSCAEFIDALTRALGG